MKSFILTRRGGAFWKNGLMMFCVSKGGFDFYEQLLKMLRGHSTVAKKHNINVLAVFRKIDSPFRNAEHLFMFFQKGASRRVSVTEINFVCGFGNMSFFS